MTRLTPDGKVVTRNNYYRSATLPMSVPFCAGDIVPPVPLNVQVISSWALSAESSGVAWSQQFALS